MAAVDVTRQPIDAFDALIPQPQVARPTGEDFPVTKGTVIACSTRADESERFAVETLNRYLGEQGRPPLKVVEIAPEAELPGGAIVVGLTPRDSFAGRALEQAGIASTIASATKAISFFRPRTAPSWSPRPRSARFTPSRH